MAASDPTTRPVPAAATLWGDGFAEDDVFDLWTARDWSLCSSDEYVLLFPRLIPQAGEFPAALRRHLENCIVARAWRLEAIGGCRHQSLLSRLPVRGDGAARHDDFFAADDAVTRVLRRIGLLRAAPGRVAAERDILGFLDALLAEVQAHRVPAWSDTAEALLAFGAGIHPAYLWPQATVSQARGVAAGWLGHLDRGRAALMPLVVAEYVLDALGDGASPDRQLVALAGAANLELLRRAALRRWSGRDAPVRLAPDAASLARVLSNRGRPTAEARA